MEELAAAMNDAQERVRQDPSDENRAAYRSAVEAYEQARTLSLVAGSNGGQPGDAIVNTESVAGSATAEIG